MTIKLGTTNINKIWLGSTEIKKAYLGSTLIHNIVSGPTLWTPQSEGSLLAWWDSNNASSITLGMSGRVNNVNTVNTSSYTLRNDLNTTRRPLPVTFNGLGAFTTSVNSATSSEFFQMSSFGFNQLSPFTFAIAMYSSSTISPSSLFQIGNGNSNNPSGRIYIVGDGASKIIRHRPSPSNIGFTIDSVLNSSSLMDIIVLTYSGSGNISGTTLYFNGKPGTTPLSTFALSYGDTFNYIGIGGTTTPTGSSAKTWGDTIVLNTAASQSTIDKLTGYLAHKWSSTSLLPSDHPYKSSAPTV